MMVPYFPPFKHVLFCAVLLVLPMLSLAQYQLTGIVADENGTPLEFAEVVLRDHDSIPKAAVITNVSGNFSFTGVSGQQTLSIVYFGNMRYSQQLQVAKNTDLGIIRISTSLELEAVTAESNKKLFERKADRLVFNVENATAASGGDALDALRLAPGVKVDNDVVSIVGKGSVAVLLNDRLMRLSGDELTAFLKSIKADDIKTLEIITNPPAKYSAEGNSGLINIKLKKIRQDSWNASAQSAWRQASYATGSANGTFNYRKNKLTVQSALGYTNGNQKNTENVGIEYPTYNWIEDSQNKDSFKPYNGRLGIDYAITDKLTIGGQYIGNHNESTGRGTINAELYGNATTMLDSIVSTKGQQAVVSNFNSVNLHGIYTIDTTGVKLSVDLDYFNYSRDERRVFETRHFLSDGNYIDGSYNSARNMGRRSINNYSVNAEMDHPLKSIRLNYGFRLAVTKTNNDFELFDLSSGLPIPDETQSNEFLFDENTQAGFIDAGKEFGKWEAKAGLRMENTRTKGTSVTTGQTDIVEYTRLFPTAYLAYKPNDLHSFSINYGKRIGRPGFEFLNPFRKILSAFAYTEGNPYLRPSFSHNIELDYSYDDVYNLSFYFSGTRDGFEQLTIIDTETFIQQYTPRNFISSNTYGISQYVATEPFKWLKTNLSADVYYSDVASMIPETLQFLDGWNGEFRITADFTLNKKKTMLFNTSFLYVTEGVDNLDTNSSFSNLSASCKVFAFDKKLQVTLYGNDLLRTGRTTYSGFSNGLRNTYSNYNDQRMVRLSIMYLFGGDIKGAGQRDGRNSEERNRI